MINHELLSRFSASHIKLLLFFLILACCFRVEASSECKKYHPRMPCMLGKWQVSGYGLYYQNTSNIINMEVGRGLQQYNLPYAWGFELEGKRYLEQGMDVMMEWLHYKQRSTLIDNNGAIFQSRVPGQVFMQENKFDIINLELGQNIFFGKYWRVRMHGGLQHASLYTQFLTVTPAGNDLVKNNIIGPRIGMLFTYQMLNTFSAYTNIAILGFYDNASIFSSGLSAIARMRGGNVDLIEQGLGIGGNFTIGTHYIKNMTNGFLTADLAWESLIYMVVRNRVGWSGFKFGLKWTGNA
jgi:hypothetical protein